jgi:hypothetical protein
MKDALPERFRVDRIGTPDPADSQYYVLDLAYDSAARVCLRRDYRTLGQHVRADELAKALDDTAETHVRVLQRLAPPSRSASKKDRQRSRS